MAAPSASVNASPAPTRGGGRTMADKLRAQKWPLGFAAAAAGMFIFYNYLLDSMPAAVQDFFDRWLPLSTVNVAVVWVIMAVGLNVVVGYAGLLDLGFVAFWAIGGYAAGWLMSGFFHGQQINIFGAPAEGQPEGIHIAFWLVLPIAAILCAMAGVLIGSPTLRLKSDYLALVTLGFGEIVPQIFYNGDDVFGHNISNGPKGISPVDGIKIPGKTLGPFDDAWKFLIICVIAAFVIFVSLRIREGRLGRAWLAIREDELAASMMGVPLMRTKLAAYGVGAIAGGLGGVAFAAQIAAVDPNRFDFSISITILAMVVLGGMGNVWGVTIGALVLAWINATGLAEGGKAVNSALGTDFNIPSKEFYIFGFILVLMMLFRREGFLPERRTKLVLHEQPRVEAEALHEDMEDLEELDR